MIKKQILIGLMVLLMKPVFAQEQDGSTVKELTLQESINYALEHNEDIKKATYDEMGSRYQINEAKSAGLPQVSATGTFDYYPNLPTQILPGAIVGKPGTDVPVKFGKDYNVQGGVTLQQLLFSQSYFVGLKAAKSAEDLYRLRKEMTQEEVIYNVGTAFFMVQQTKEQFKSIEANLDKLAQLERILTLQYKNDLVKKVDVTRIQVNRTNLENTKKSLQTGYEQQLNMLKFFMGMPLEEQIALQASEINMEAQTLSANLENAPNARTQYQLLAKQKELKGLEIQGIRSGYYPTLSAYGRYAYQTQRNEGQLFDSETPWFKTSVVGLQLNIPIFDGFKKSSQVKQRELELQKYETDIKKFNKSVMVELNNAISQLQNSQSAIAAQEKNVDLAQEVYDTTNKLYKEGISPLTDLLDSEVTLREAKTNLNNEVLKYKIAQLNYLKAKGELDSLTK
ncbi:TolC family protein [Pontibacter sp. MBLB2868]|uniref:TolC family protein n=1 Tax=Pontibacter sp. MBLB2868 TaxID=3451555 RepID=UPI003F74DD86